MTQSNSPFSQIKPPQSGTGFMSIQGASHPASLVSGKLVSLRQADDDVGLTAVIQEQGGQGKRRTIKLTLRQQQVITLLRESGGVMSEDECALLDGRVLKGLYRTAIIVPFGKGIALTEEAGYMLDTQSESEEGFRDRCEDLFGSYGWQSKLARALGVTRQTVVKWASGRLEVPEHVVALLECLESMKEQSLPYPKRFRW